MFNDDEYTTEDRAAGVWGTLLLLATLGSCANTPKDVNQDRKPEKVPIKIEQRQNVATNQFYRVKQTFLIHTK